MTATQVFDGFGETVSTSGSTPTYGYDGTSGYRDDGDAGLTHVGARYYDASVGRFITRDTDLTQKPYTYCEGDPINSTDPTGHQAIDWDDLGLWDVLEDVETFLYGGAGQTIGGTPGAVIGLIIGHAVVVLQKHDVKLLEHWKYGYTGPQ